MVLREIWNNVSAVSDQDGKVFRILFKYAAARHISH